MTTIEIGGESYPLHFKTAALNQYCIAKGNMKLGKLVKQVWDCFPKGEDGIPSTELGASDLSFLDSFSFSLDDMMLIFRLGVNSGFRKLGQEKALSPEDVIDLFDERPGLVMEVFALFSRSVMTTFNGQASEDEEKKAQAADSAASKS